MALIGCPSLLFLDEPTTGVDPISRRCLMKLLKRLDLTSMILTTHRMDEAEALCNKIAIMINGQFACYGSPDELKSEYVNGYKVIIYHSDSSEEMQETIAMELAELEFQETVSQPNLMSKSIFYVTLIDLKLSDLCG